MTAKVKHDFYLLVCVLMSNHYHLLIKTTKPNLSRIMHYINGSYTTCCNVKRGKTGHLFQGRYKSLVIDADSYFQELTGYIHLNPIRAKDEGAGGEQGRYKDRKVDGGEHEDKESGKEANLYFSGLTPFSPTIFQFDI